MNTIFTDYHSQEVRDRLQQIANKKSTDIDTIRRLLKHAIDKDIATISRIIAGEANEVYAIKTDDSLDVILRISHGDKNPFIIEASAIDEAGKAGVPVAQVLSAGEYKENETSLFFFIQEAIQGRTLDLLIWSDHIGEARTKRITEEAGEYLAKLHTVKTSGTGKLVDKGIGRFMTTEERLTHIHQKGDMLERIFADYPHMNIPSMNNVIDRLQAMTLYSDADARLLHTDYAPKHLFVDAHDRIAGVIDFGEVHSGDPSQDLAIWDFWYKDSVPVDWLHAGYERISSTGYHYQERFNAVQLYMLLEIIMFFTINAPGPKHAERAAARIKHLLDT